MDKENKFDENHVIQCCFTEDFAHAIQLLAILQRPLDFSQPFRMTIDYDPKRLRTEMEIVMPTKALVRYNQRVQGKETD